jgi:hypothetical protein
VLIGRPPLPTEDVDLAVDDEDDSDDAVVFVIVLLNPVVVVVGVEAVDVEEALLDDIAVLVIELEMLAAARSTAGAGAANVSSVGFAQSVPFWADQPQHAQRPVSGLYITPGVGLSAQYGLHSPLS